MSVVAIIPARGGSKGIPRKNLMDFCGKPLIAWSILQAKAVNKIESVWVTSDDDEILHVSEKYGAKTIKRPSKISGDTSSSESAWIHAIGEISKTQPRPDVVVGLQATSPLRQSSDLAEALNQFYKNNADSMLSLVEIEDFFIWRECQNKAYESVNYDYKNRLPRQLIDKRYLENGSFYIFNVDGFLENKNRLFGDIDGFIMSKLKMFQIDNHVDVELCRALMKNLIELEANE